MEISTPVGASHGLGIKTPVAVSTAPHEDEVDMAPRQAPLKGKNVGKFIPAASYAVPAPTWRVKPQFASWEIDHMRFEVKRLLGKGSYGSVAEAFDHLTNQRVAIKKIANVFDVFENAKRIYREVRILRLLAHPNIVKIVHLQQPNDLLHFTDLYVVFECMDTDFSKLCRDDTQCLTVPHVRWFLYQLLLSIKYLHSARVIHRDIKPANVLLTESCDLKLCDFGLARSLDVEAGEGLEVDNERDIIGVAAGIPTPAATTPASSTSDPADGSTPSTMADAPGVAASDGSLRAKSMTKHVVTRWYRAPELPLYNDGEYSLAVDMWSVGCVYAEMLGMLDTGDPEARFDRHALFPGGYCYPLSRDRSRDKAGKEKKDQLQVIFDVLGTPKDEEIARVRTDAARDYLRSVHPKAPEDLNKRFPTAGRDATDLLLRLLAFLPEDRLTIDGALAHPFLAPVRRPHDEVGRAEGPVHFHRVGADNIRERMVEEIRAYNAHIPDNWQELAAAGLYQGYSAGTFVKEGDGEDLSATGEGST